MKSRHAEGNDKLGLIVNVVVVALLLIRLYALLAVLWKKIYVQTCETLPEI